MNRLDQCFQNLAQQGRKALIPFITAGDPNPVFTLSCMHAMVAAGADIIELGVPFSDPMSDGPVIQRASERALQGGMNIHKVIDLVRQFRAEDATTPIVLMGYLNPIEFMGYQRFSEAAAEAGVDGVLTVDMPPEESHELVECFKQFGLSPIFLIAPTSTDERIERVSAVAKGYLYYVSLKGVTGAGHLDVDSVAQKLDQIRAHTQLPIGVGFGVKTPETAAILGKISDAVVVGSALIERIVEHIDELELAQSGIRELLSGMRRALDDSMASGQMAS